MKYVILITDTHPLDNYVQTYSEGAFDTLDLAERYLNACMFCKQEDGTYFTDNFDWYSEAVILEIHPPKEYPMMLVEKGEF